MPQPDGYVDIALSLTGWTCERSHKYSPSDSFECLQVIFLNTVCVHCEGNNMNTFELKIDKLQFYCSIHYGILTFVLSLYAFNGHRFNLNGIKVN